MRGRFITFEGGEGSGKSTQARLLAGRLREAGRDVVTTREPGGTPFAEAVRALVLDPARAPKSPLSEALLFYAARAELLADTIRPALELGQWVVCDRFSDSTRVYQGLARGLGLATVDTLERLVVADTRPDLTVLCDIAPEIGLARAGRRRAEAGSDGPDTFEARRIDFHRRLRDGFMELARAEPGRFVVVDASVTPDAVAEAVWTAVSTRLGAF